MLNSPLEPWIRRFIRGANLSSPSNAPFHVKLPMEDLRSSTVPISIYISAGLAQASIPVILRPSPPLYHEPMLGVLSLCCTFQQMSRRILSTYPLLRPQMYHGLSGSSSILASSCRAALLLHPSTFAARVSRLRLIPLSFPPVGWCFVLLLLVFGYLPSTLVWKSVVQ
ncbi:hypothetical protein PHLGIDRAFT_29929 [Phlebiopsis gigantea 11061_1 CR5-6]|uniref:Uncharacterized protein n=1 Tax=Phlebiopsis gigantea (strain 11061_1 CR5-6) TaxID=745531 RepID=A0A0C3RZ90_PHLG1|nr:hypothetical protein PHLGIDRAFT_29929 [Phlebiopsis gigantea 11061_1 CR5-6]